MIRILINGVDATTMIPTVAWSGDYQQCTRTLNFDLLSSFTDKSLPVISCPLGTPVQLWQETNLLFDGFVFYRQKATNSSVLDITCFDRGIYLKRNVASYKPVNSTPEAFTKRVCADFEIPTGDLATTGFALSWNFPNDTLYDMIQTSYTLASVKTKKKYQLGFRGTKLCVWEKSSVSNAPMLEGGVNLMDASVSESIQNMINQVQIYNNQEKLIRTVKNDLAVQSFGLMQDRITQVDGVDSAAKAQQLLEDNGEEQKIMVNNLGNVQYITGTSVIMQEPYTGLYGLFYIDSDVHTWKNGLYVNQLVLNFRNLMDEKEAGAALSRGGR